MSLKFGFLVLFVSSIVLIVNSAYLDNQPKWNWEEVILSRNGPSTTTTPRPKFWSEFKTNFHFQTSPFQLQNCFKFVLLVLMVIKVGIPSWYLPRQSFWKMCNRVLNGVNHEDFHISKSGQRYRFGYRMSITRIIEMMEVGGNITETDCFDTQFVIHYLIKQMSQNCYTVLHLKWCL